MAAPAMTEIEPSEPVQLEPTPTSVVITPAEQSSSVGGNLPFFIFTRSIKIPKSYSSQDFFKYPKKLVTNLNELIT